MATELLLQAAKIGNIDAAKAAVAAGANIYATTRSHVKFVSGIRYVHNLSAFDIAVIEDYKNLVFWLLEIGYDIHCCHDYIPIQCAVKFGSVDMIGLLISRGADINRQNKRGTTCVGVASSIARMDILEYLLSHGAQVDTQNNNGHTALHEACYLKYVDVIELLLAYGADPNIADWQGNTPIDILPDDISDELFNRGTATKSARNTKSV